jgi:hypothetical protein
MRALGLDEVREGWHQAWPGTIEGDFCIAVMSDKASAALHIQNERDRRPRGMRRISLGRLEPGIEVEEHESENRLLERLSTTASCCILRGIINHCREWLSSNQTALF